jgi:hypothetical protein
VLLDAENIIQKWEQKGVFMSRTFMPRSLVNFTRFIGNYRYYRRNGFNFRKAWHLAGMTLP